MLKLRLLGAPAILDDTHELRLPSQKAQALLFYLAAESGRSFARSQLITLLWEESSERDGRNSLSTVLTRLRQTLPAFPVRAEGDTLAWQQSADIIVDLHEFQALAPPRATAQAAPGAADIQRLEAAAALYRGTFLDGFSVRDSEGYEEWLRLEREQWQQRWLDRLEQLIAAYTANGDWSPAIGHARRALAADPFQERFHRALMRLHYLSGDRAAALAQFRACRALLDRELGIEPDVDTTTLYQMIVAGTLERTPRQPSTPAAAPPTPAPPAQPTTRLGARLASARRRSFVGRADELTFFADALADSEPAFVVLHIYGPGGVGKSTLLNEFIQLCGKAGVMSLLLDARNIQPTPDGFLSALHEQIGTNDPIAALPDRLVLLIDTYELLTPIESWLRDHFLPQLPDRALVALASRNPPSAGWRIDPGWQAITTSIKLDNLSEADARDYLSRRNIPSEQHDAVLHFTHCYPLALSLAVEVLLQKPTTTFESATSPDIVRVLLARFIADVPSTAHRAALEACSQVRVLSEPLLAALLDMTDAHDLFEWLRDLSFVSTGPRGIFPHDLARAALAADLHWRNQPWHLELHRRARAFYLVEFERSQAQSQQLVLLDLIFLHDNPLLRSIITWNDIGGLLEDTPRMLDWPALTEMVRHHEGEESARIAAHWFARQPENVKVFRDAAGELTGFSLFVVLHEQEHDHEQIDPCVQAIRRYLADQPPLADGQFVAIGRLWMARDSYQSISPTQGMIFVASTRYLLTTPGLAYSFHVITEPDLWQPILAQLLIQRLPQADFSVGQRHYGLFMHDWRALPPRAWLDELAKLEIKG